MMYNAAVVRSLFLLVLSIPGLLAGCGTSGGGDGVLVTQQTSDTAASAPFAVGSSTLFIHDQSRPFDAVAGVNTGVRTLITELWYPVERQAVTPAMKRATYGDYVFGNRDVHRQMMTQTTFFHLTPQSVRAGVTAEQIDAAIDALFDRPRGSYTDAPAAAGKPWPVVVVSHGDAGSRYNMQSVSEFLAAQGYLVVAAEHTGNSPYAMIGADPDLAATGGDPALIKAMKQVLPLLDDNGVYGNSASYGQSYSPLGEGGILPGGKLSAAGIVDLDRALLERVNDLRAVLKVLDAMNESGRFAGKIDLSRVGLMGRSFGASTVLAGLALEPRFRAGVAVVPPSLPDLRPLLPPELLVQSPAESVLLSAQAAPTLARLQKPTLLLVSAEDRTIMGTATYLAKLTGTALPTPESPYPTLEAAFAKADVPAVYASLDNANHGSCGVSGPYWWPQLKPDIFPRFFSSDASYQLMAPEIAHRIQQEMALAFFDVMVRGDQSGLDTLQHNPWQKYGVSVRTRGFTR